MLEARVDPGLGGAVVVRHGSPKTLARPLRQAQDGAFDRLRANGAARAVFRGDRAGGVGVSDRGLSADGEVAEGAERADVGVRGFDALRPNGSGVAGEDLVDEGNRSSGSGYPQGAPLQAVADRSDQATSV